MSWDKKILLSSLEEAEKKLKGKNPDEEIKTEIEILKKIKNLSENEEWLAEKMGVFSEEKTRLKATEIGKKLSLLSSKPLAIIFNVTEDNISEEKKHELKSISPGSLFIDAKREEDALELTETEKEELNVSSRLDDLIINCYNKLNLITFYTIKGGEELRAYELKKGRDIVTAAGKVHTDFQKKFIRAEVLPFKDFDKSCSWQEAKKRGFVGIKGREYIVSDGDIIELKI
ncbi:MAG: DUF933 domain-containing protein [Patescibacteria group bacterium]